MSSASASPTCATSVACSALLPNRPAPGRPDTPSPSRSSGSAARASVAAGIAASSPAPRRLGASRAARRRPSSSHSGAASVVPATSSVALVRRGTGSAADARQRERLELPAERRVAAGSEDQRRRRRRTGPAARVAVGAGPGVEQRAHRVLPGRHAPRPVEQQLAAPHLALVRRRGDGEQAEKHREGGTACLQRKESARKSDHNILRQIDRPIRPARSGSRRAAMSRGNDHGPYPEGDGVPLREGGKQ